MFLSFTNGTLIDEAFADEMLRVKNFVPAISVEGFEEATDGRRGQGTYQKVMHAMEILQAEAAALRHLLLLHQHEYRRHRLARNTLIR